MTVRTKLPVDAAGKVYQEDSATYHVGDYTYEEILEGLTVDMEASRTAHDVLNELRQDKSKRPSISQSYPEASAREWCDACYQESVVRGSRNIICSILNSWNPGEISTVNPLATHGGNQNGYGSSGWENTGADLGKAAIEFFYDGGHAANQTNVRDKYSATAVVQYKNAAGINLTSMIVTMSPYSYEREVENAASNSITWVDDSIKGTHVPSDQYYDICKHFGLSWGMEENQTVSNAGCEVLFADSTVFTDNENELAQAETDVIQNGAEVNKSDDEAAPEEVTIDESDSLVEDSVEDVTEVQDEE